MAVQHGGKGLSTRNLTKSFGSVVAVDGVTWEIPPGETKGIIGPNGAGKTTFFSLLTGDLDATEGQIILGDEEITNLEQYEVAQRGLSNTYQITNVFPELTAFENLCIAAQADVTTFDVLRKASDLDEVNQRAETIIERLALGEYRDMKLEELSYGWQRITELGMALATEPEILLLDEPTAGLADDAITNFLEMLESVIAEGDMTVVFIEHNLEVATRLADTLSVMHEGQLFVEGSPEEVFENEKVKDIYLE
jgi:branched-chain amino acid transport system ATP-binding protein